MLASCILCESFGFTRMQELLHVLPLLRRNGRVVECVALLNWDPGFSHDVLSGAPLIR